MTLDEAIQHCEEVADEKEEDAILYHNCATHKQNLYEKGLAENTEKECRACAEEHRQLAEWLKELKAYRENTCGDAISRKHLLEEIAMLKKSPWFNENTYGSKIIRKEAVEIVEDVCIKREPSVTPQPKMGRWIADVDKWGEIVTTVNGFRCSECNTFNTDKDNYCPNCGAKMEVE